MFAIIWKDIVLEARSRETIASLLVFGVVVLVVFNFALDVTPANVLQLAPGLLWVAIVLSAVTGLGRTFLIERENSCMTGLLLAPVERSSIYLAKLAVNFIALLALECVLVPLFVILADVSLLRHVWAMGLVAVLGSLCMAAVGTLVGALTHGLSQRAAVLSLLVLPLLLPVVLAAAEATRLVAENDLGDQWWRWVQFLGAFAIVFTTLGIVMFGILIEE